MGNCLITKLKGVVDNNELPYYDAFKVHVYKLDSVDQTYAHILSSLGTNPTIKIVGNGTVTIGSNVYKESDGIVTVTSARSDVWKLSNEDFDIFIFKKYGLTTISAGNANSVNDTCKERGLSIDLSQFNYSDSLESIGMCGVKFTGEFKNFKSLKYCNLFDGPPTAYNLPSITVHGEDIAKCNSLVSFVYNLYSSTNYNNSGSNINVTLSDFVNHANIISIIIPFSNSSGEVIDFATSQFKAGRRTGSIRFQTSGTNITLEGHPTTNLENSYPGKGISSVVYQYRVTYNSTGFIVELQDSSNSNWIQVINKTVN